MNVQNVENNSHILDYLIEEVSAEEEELLGSPRSGGTKQGRERRRSWRPRLEAA